MPSHLLLSLTRIQEQQNVIRDLHQRMLDVEVRVTRHGQQLIAAATAASTLSATVVMHDQRHAKALHDEISGVNRGVQAVSKELHTGMAKVTGDITTINRSLMEIRPFLASLKKP